MLKLNVLLGFVNKRFLFSKDLRSGLTSDALYEMTTHNNKEYCIFKMDITCSISEEYLFFTSILHEHKKQNFLHFDQNMTIIFLLLFDSRVHTSGCQKLSIEYKVGIKILNNVNVISLSCYVTRPCLLLLGGEPRGRQRMTTSETVQTTKTELRNALRQQLLSCLPNKLNVKEDKNYVLTTVVDPCYKFKFLNNKETAKKWLLEEMQTTVMPVNSDANTQATDKDGNTHKAAGKKNN